MVPYKLNELEVLKDLHSNIENGLSDVNIKKNLEKYGKNKLEQKKGPSLLKQIWNSLKEPMMIILLAACIITFGVNLIKFFNNGEADFIECIGIVMAIGLSTVITVGMERHSQNAFEALNKIQDNVIIRVLRKEIIMLPQVELIVGDIVFLETGDKIPADCRLLSSVELLVNESALTGESNPVQKNSKILLDEATPLAERKNMIYSGCFITSGSCTAVVTAVGSQTELGKIANELGRSDRSTTPLQERLNKLGKLITLFGLAAATLAFLIQFIRLLISNNLSFSSIGEILITSIILIVAAVPEGLPTIVAVSLALNVVKMARENALVKKMIACETIGCINVICSDKTGTLTQNKMTVKAYYDGKWQTNPETMLSEHMAHNICLNTTASLNYQGEKPEFIGNPTECAMLSAYQNSEIYKKTKKSYNEERKDHETLHMFPFSSDEKHMTTISEVDDRIISYVKGSPELILSMCVLSKKEIDNINKIIELAQNQAMRVIAFAHKFIDSEIDYASEDEHEKLESNMIFDGFVAITDPVRPEVYESITTCQKAGISLKILTGDHINTARAVAEQLDIIKEDSLVFNASEIESMTDEELGQCIDKIVVIARSTPSLKLRIVKILMKLGNIVAVTGDGVNDAPAISYADAGIAMGISGTEVSKEAADIVLMDDSFATISKAVYWGRGIYKNFQRFITFQLTVNLSSVITVLASVLFGFVSPFTALQLLWINIIMDGPPALTLGLEAPKKNLMEEKPVLREADIITKSMFTNILINGLWISIIFLLQTFFNFLGAEQTEQSTVLFTLFVLFQLLNSFNCRELGNKSIFSNLLGNFLMLLVFMITFGLQVIITQFGGIVFDTVPLSLILWIKIILVSFSIIMISELAKLIKKSSYSRFA